MIQNETPTSEPDSPLRVRLATDADWPRLIPLINSAFAIETFLEGTRTDDERLAAMMQQGRDPDGRRRRRPASRLRLHGSAPRTSGVRGYLGQLAVDPAHQGKGLARRIFQAAEDHLRRHGCEAVDITVLSLRPELPPIYRRFGYIETGMEEFQPSRPLKSGAECHCIVMSKQL